MPSTTQLLTRHNVTMPGSPFAAEMVLDDGGRGTVTLVTLEGQAVATFDAASAESIRDLMAESAQLRDLMRQSGSEIVTGTPDVPPAFA